MSLRSDLLDPIAGANPAGANLRYEPVYDQIKLARTEEADVPQGEWKRERKTADYGLVVKLAGEALAKKSKDLQLAAWLTEALIHREGFAGLRQGLDLLRSLAETFWEHVYPEIEDDDLELRAVPLEWVGQYLDVPVRLVPLNRSGHAFTAYKESRAVPSEDDADSDSAKLAARNAALAEGKLTPEEFDDGFKETPKAWYRALVADLDGALESLAALDAVGHEKFGDAAPGYHRLRDALREVRQVAGQLLARKLEADPDPPAEEPVVEESGKASAGEVGEPVTGAVAGAGAAAGSGPGATPAAAPVSAAPRSRDDAAARVAVAAKFMRAESPTDPAPYLMLRGLRWGELRARGGAIDPKLLLAPRTEIRTRLKGLVLDEQWAELLEAAEEVMATPYGRGWLDLQRYVLTACAGLGTEYDAVAAAIRGALRSLLRDVPGLLDETLMDDSPTANRETRGWLRSEGLLAPGEGEDEADAADAGAAAAPAGRGRDPYQRAMARVRAGQPQQAIELLMREAAQETSPRARFLRRSEAAAIMVDTGLEAVAAPILNELLEQVERHGLEEWEAGEVVARPLGLLYRCARRLDLSVDAESLYLRICRLDPLQAIHFANPSSDGEAGAEE